MENGVCQEVADNDIQWKFQEIIQLLRGFKEHRDDFQQIAHKLKGNAEPNKRPKNFYTPELCESAFKKILSISQEKPFFVELFKTIDYSEEVHALKLLEQYEDYQEKITEFVEKTLLNDKFKNMLMALEKDELSPENTEKMTRFCKSFPSLVEMVRGIDEYGKIMQKKSIFEEIMPERDKLVNLDDLKSTLNAKCEELQKQKEIENAASSASSAPETPKSLPSSSKTPQILSSSTRLAETKPLPKNTPSVKNDVSTKRSRPPSGTPLSSVSPKTPARSPITETPVIKKKKPTSSTPKIPNSIKPIAPAEQVKLRKRNSVASKKPVTYHEPTPFARDAETQTNICLLVKFDGPQLPPMIDKSKKAVSTTKGSQTTRTVMTQTGKIYLNFNNDFDTFKWYDFEDVPSEMAVELANSCLRSDHDFISDKPIKVTMYLDESKFDDPYLVKLKKHPLYKVLVEIQEADSGGFFKYPVKIEVPDYPSWIKNPMDLLTIEDLMIDGKIKDIDDLEIYCHLITTNAVVFGAIPTDAEEFAEKLVGIFNRYRTKSRK